MPKLIVLFYGDENNASGIAEAAAAGAKSIRFTEIDLRSGASVTPEAVAEYDGVVIAAPAGTTHEELIALLVHLRHHGHATNTVFALAAGPTELREALSRIGGIIVTVPAGGDVVEQARQIGARTAKVAGWVRHGLAHEADHHRHQGHDHSHQH